MTSLFASLLSNDDQAGALLRTLSSLRDAGIPAVVELGPEASGRVEQVAAAFATRAVEPAAWALRLAPGETLEGSFPASLESEAYALEIVVMDGDRGVGTYVAPRLLKGGARAGEAAPVLGGVQVIQPAEMAIAGPERLEEARALIAQGLATEARLVLEAGLAELPGFPPYHAELGGLLRQAGAWQEARSHFEACLAARGRLFPYPITDALTGVLAHLELAALGWLLEEPDATRRHLDAASEVLSADERSRVEAFRRFLTDLEGRSPQSAVSSGVEAVTAALAGKETVDEIVGVLRLYTEEFPRCESGFQVLGQTLSTLGRDEEAAFALLSSLSLNSSDAMNYQLLSFALMTLGKLDWADACQAMGDFLDGLGAFPAMPESDGSSLDEELARVLQLARPTVSACLIVKNEAAVLERCLASLKDVVDEIIVVDTGSTDETVAIAERHGAKVSHFAWCDDFAAARNASLAQASSDWILVIDADETLVLDDPAAFKQALHLRKFGGYLLDQVNRFDDGTVERNPLTRLFQRHEALRFEGHLHEHVEEALVRLGWPVDNLGVARFDHDGYLSQGDRKADKAARNLSLALQGVARAPEQVRNWAMLGVAAVSAKDYPLALEAFGRMLDLEVADPTGAIAAHDSAMTMYLGVLFELDRRPEARDVLERYLAIALGEPRLYRLRSHLRREAGETVGALLDTLASDLLQAPRLHAASTAV